MRCQFRLTCLSTRDDGCVVFSFYVYFLHVYYQANLDVHTIGLCPAFGVSFIRVWVSRSKLIYIFIYHFVSEFLPVFIPWRHLFSSAVCAMNYLGITIMTPHRVFTLVGLER